MGEVEPRKGKKTIKSVRPWGDIHMIVRNQPCSVDLTHIRPGHRASLHTHSVKYELFHFIDAGGYLELNGEVFRPEEHEEYLIKPGDAHRFWAEDNDFRMLVICFGEWNAKDQVRLEDDYGRKGQELEL